MKKMISLLLAAVLIIPILIPAAAFAQTSMQNLAAQGVRDVPTNYRIQADYGSRTDGQAEYLGYAPWGAQTTDEVWIVYRMTYDEDGQLLTRDTAYGAWGDRAALAYQ